MGRQKSILIHSREREMTGGDFEPSATRTVMLRVAQRRLCLVTGIHRNAWNFISIPLVSAGDELQ